jgi:HlyD family secretion protein
VLASLAVVRGDPVHAGQPLFALDAATLTADRDAAAASLAQAKAQWANLTKGKRPEEIAVIQQQIVNAATNVENTRREWRRTDALAQEQLTSIQARDAAKDAYDAAVAQAAELEKEMKVAGLSGRTDELNAAAAAIQVAAQRLAQAEKRLVEAAPAATVDAQIEETYYHVGEFVAAGSPVVSLLPPENVKVRFFVPEKRFAQFRLKEAVTIHCDGCPGPIPATITYLATQAEFTPPVIYSVESRDKLVFMIEATPDHVEPALKPGLPVDVVPTEQEPPAAQ